MRSSTILFTTLLVLSIQVRAQQDPVTALFENHVSFYNPAFSALLSDHHGAICYRNQWDGVNGAPASLLVNDNHRFGDHHGVGVNYFYDQIGFTRAQNVALNYNYQFTFGGEGEDQHRMSIGISPGIFIFSLDPEWVAPSTYNGASLPEAFTTVEFNIDFGLAYTWKGLFAGSSIRHLQSYFEPNTTYNMSPHYTHYGGYTFKTGQKKHVEITPQLFLITDFVKMSANVQLLGAYSVKGKQRIWLGAGYRSNDAVQFMGGFDLYKKFRLGYGYELTLSKLGTISHGTHEIVLGYSIQPEKK